MAREVDIIDLDMLNFTPLHSIQGEEERDPIQGEE
jgi:hypothetical protein